MHNRPKPKILAVIPARGGSKRIPRKNIKDFCGRPMIEHVIETAKKSELFHTIHVSSDDEEILSCAASCGYVADFKRPVSLANDYTNIMEVLNFTVSEYEARGESFDIICLLYATSPLMDINDLKKAAIQFENGSRDRALLSVARYSSPIERAWTMKDNGNIQPKNPDALKRRSQDIPFSYYDAAMFCFYTPDHIRNAENTVSALTFDGFKIPEFRAIDIDEPDDWLRAEYMYNFLQTKEML